MVNSQITLASCVGPLLLGCASAGIVPTHCAHDGVMVGDHLREGDANYTVTKVFGYSPHFCAKALSTHQTGVTAVRDAKQAMPITCRSDADCPSGTSCRSVRGGGTECRLVVE